MRRARRAVLVLGLLAAGCSSDPAPSFVLEGQDAATPEVELPGPGTPLADGFVVPEGSRLLGPPIGPLTPAPGQQATNWTAPLLLTSDAGRALRDLADQADAKGIVLGGTCDAQIARRWDGCYLSGKRISDGLVMDYLTIQAVQSGPRARYGAGAHVIVTYTRWLEGRVPRRQGVPVQPLRIADFPPLPPWDVPEAGEEILPDSHFGARGTTFDLIPGVRVIGPVRTLAMCLGGFSAWLQVTGDLDGVIAAHRRVLAELGLDWRFNQEEGEHRGRRTIALWGTNGDTDLGLDITAGNGDEPTWAELSYCVD